MKIDMIKYIERSIFCVRWMMLPLYAGLVAALGLYTVHFVHEIITMFHNFYANYEVQNILMLSILELVDMTMISQLILMSIQGGYSIFVKEFDHTQNRPRWLSANFGSSEQKIKLGMSIIGIMIVNFLHDFIQSHDLSMDNIIPRLWLMGAVIVATLAFCIFNLMMHHPMLEHKKEHIGHA